MADVQPVKDAQKLIWSVGDYRELARVYEPAAVALVDACAAGPGMELLDEAAGTGNVAVAAARRGTRVVASDFTARTIELGKPRTVTLRFGSVQAVLDSTRATTVRSSLYSRVCRPGATRR